MKYTIFEIQGGLGKNIQATAVARAIKRKHPDRELIVLASYPVVFLNLRFIWRVYNINGLQYFYDDFIKDKDTILYTNEVYKYGDYIKGNHIIKSWFDMFDLGYTGSEKPELVFNAAELSVSNKWERNKPVAIIHSNGGLKSDPHMNSWARDLPYNLGLMIVDELKRNNYHIIQFCNKNEQILNGVDEAYIDDIPIMEFLSVLLWSKKNILIDSSLQHAARALNKRSCVIWGSTSPEKLGYDFHSNIKLEIPDIDSIEGMYDRYDFSGQPHQCPWIDKIDLDFNKIIEYIKE